MLGDQLLQQDEMKRKQEKLFEQQKKFRNLETDKKYFADQTINAIKKQKMSIDKLKKENQALKQLIAKVNNQRNQDNVHGASFQHMKNLINQINAAIQVQKDTQKNIEGHINNFQKKIIEKRKNCLGMNSGAQSESNLQKQIKILENRLDKANQKFNQTIAANKDLKHVIDSLRRERVIFDNLYQKLEKELHQKRKNMADIIERANNAYEQRDKANNQIHVLKGQAKKEAGQFQREIKDMSHLMEKFKMNTFAKNLGNKYPDQNSNFYDTQPQNIQIKTSKPTKKSTQQMEKVQKFREDFAKIEAATEIQNFDQLLRIFSDNQEKNFQMFKFVNLQSNQIQDLQIQVAKLKEQLENQRPKGNHQGKDILLDELEKKLSTTRKSLRQIEEHYKNEQKQAKTIGSQIQRIFETIECDRELAKQIGGSKSISQTNLLVFLAIIEHKAIQIINTFKQLSNSHMINMNPKKNGPQPSILTFQDFEDNQDYDKILTADELRKKAADFILKQQGQKQKKKQTKSKKK